MTATTGSGGAWSADPASISLAAGGAVKLVAAGLVYCDPYNPVNTLHTLQQDKWNTGTTITYQSARGVTPLYTGSTLEFSGLTGTRSAQDAVSVTGQMAFNSATAASGSFDIDVGFSFSDSYSAAGAGARVYNFEASATYIGYIDKDCDWVNTADNLLDSDQSYAIDQGYANVNLPKNDADTIPLTGSTAQGQPGDAVAIVVNVIGHLINENALGPTPVDFKAGGVGWVVA